MSTQFEKLIARHELGRRRLEKLDQDIKQIEELSDEGLEAIILEPDNIEKGIKGDDQPE